MRIGGSRRQGFTLTEVLVALAIMVILFALLFAPMIAGLEWVTGGQADVTMQDAARYAMEQVRRELTEAVYVQDPPGHSFSGDDGVLGTYDDIRVVNYSQIIFSPPARDQFGKVYSPPRPAPGQYGYQKVVRYAIHLADTAQAYDEENPFVLYRQEFVWNPTQPYPLGSFDTSAVWQPGVPLVENALTPKRSATFVPTTTVFLDGVGGAGQYPEYLAGYVENTGGRPVMYLFNGLRFEPQRVVGEELNSENGILYTAKHSSWAGASLKGSFLANERLARSELDPRVIMFAWDATNQRYDTTRTDSQVAQVRPVKMRWSPDGGAVTCGQQARQEWPASSGNIVYHKVVNFSTVPNSNGWYTVSMPGDLTAVYPGSTAGVPADTARAPITYRIDPSADISVPAQIELDSIKVRAVAVDSGGTRHEVALKRTNDFDQKNIKGDEVCIHVMRQDYNSDGAPDGTIALLRMSRFDPPCPSSTSLFGGPVSAPTSFQLQISYYYRRNYTYDSTRDSAGQYPFVDDIVKADYSVRNIQNVSLALERYVDLVDAGSNRLIVPGEENPNEVSLREQVVIRNFGR